MSIFVKSNRVKAFEMGSSPFRQCGTIHLILFKGKSAQGMEPSRQGVGKGNPAQLDYGGQRIWRQAYEESCRHDRTALGRHPGIL